ncbi:hypothetical protein SDC9_104688 [bioreactor metagenome]|uniref:Uncharacterized protein n=1 Tax=bioreactor metagenome TaxID=1076179 RepID=A0A645B842_9ZZZZ
MTYKLCVTVIERGTYGTKEEMASKLDVFLLNNRITQEEYNELAALLDNK